jgi:polysaccharide pyruvyl transferase WcaK-like protein
MKILQVTNFFKPSWESGGPARVAYGISKKLVERGHEVTVYTTDGFKSRLDGKNETTIFIFGYYGWKNTGEDAMIYGLLRELHILYPTATFAILSQTAITVPQETKNLIKFVRPAPQTIFQEIMHSSIFIMGGGTHISDYGDRIVRLKIMSAIFIMLIWAKLFCKRIYLISIGVGPLSTTWGRFLSKQIYRLANFISVRDKLSYDILEGMGLKNKVTLSFDLAALLQPLSTDDNSLVKRRNRNILGISILPFFEMYHSDKEKDLLFVHEIAKGLNQWLKRDSQSMIYLFVFKDKLKYNDVLFTEMLQKQLESSERVKLIPYNPDPVLILSQVAQCDAFIGMRYHSCVFAYLTNIPLLIINYFQKCQALAEDAGLAKHAVVSLEEILNGEFEKYLKNLQENPDDFVATLPVDIAKQKAKNGLPIDKKFGVT